MEYKQDMIGRTLEQRILDGVYPGRLPIATELAAEFKVNVKTLNKVLAGLVERGLVMRKRRLGTVVLPPQRKEENSRLVEVIFEGFDAVFVHPFWGAIWNGLTEKLMHAGYRPVLYRLNAAPQTGILQLDDFLPTPAVGRIVLGIAEDRFWHRLRTLREPVITGCDPLPGSDVPQVSFDFTRAMHQAADYLHAEHCRKIAFIGETSSYISQGALHKFFAYSNAVQKYGPLDPALVENARPVPEEGAAALKKLLDRVRPDAVIAAYDNQLPELLQLLRERHLDIPVVGCDGVDIPELPRNRPVIVAPRRKCGETLAENLIVALRDRNTPASRSLPAVFYH